MQQRGSQSRRARALAGSGATPPPSSGGTNVWAIVAIIAIIAATAGWTTVGAMVLTGQSSTASAGASPAATDDDVAIDDPDDETDPEIDESSHDAPALEALLPTVIDGTPMSIESWTGDILEDGDSWGAAMAAYITSVGKVPADLATAQAYDPEGETDILVTVTTLDGVAPDALRDAMVEAWKVDYPTLTTSEIEIGGVPMIKGDFGEGATNTYWFDRGGILHSIDTSDEAMVATALAALPAPAAPGASASPAPAASPSPS